MKAYLLPALAGLLMGLTLRWTQLGLPMGLRSALALRRSHTLRSALYALGFSMALTAFLCYLAVIDVDTIDVLPLSAGVLAGGVIFGAAAGLCGFTPLTAFSGLGGGAALEALCVLAGCAAMTLLAPRLQRALTALQALPPLCYATLFQVTLDEPFLLGGGFLGQGCAGFALMALAICIPSPKAAAPIAAVPAEPVADVPAEDIVALLPGEEPLVVDAAVAAEDDADDELMALDMLWEEPEDES